MERQDELDLLTTRQVAALYGVRPRAVVRQVKRGDYAQVVERRAGRSVRYLIPRSEVLRTLAWVGVAEQSGPTPPADYSMTAEEVAALLGGR